MKITVILFVILVQTTAIVHEQNTTFNGTGCSKEILILPLDKVPYKPELCRDKKDIDINLELYSRVPEMTICPIICRFSDGHISGFKTCINGEWKGNVQCDEKPKRRKKRGWWGGRRRAPPPPPPDITPPSLNCPPTITVTVSEILQRSMNVTWTEPVASDDRNGVIIPSRNGPGPGSTFDEGSNRVEYTASDSAGNTAICSLSIIVNVVRCPTPLYISPGTFSCSPSDFIAGATCYFYCTEMGYELAGSSYTTCIISGTWYNDIPKCQRVTCGDPGTVNHGSAVSNGYNYGDVVRYTCDIHYNLTGVSARTCQANETWSGQKPSCNYVNSCASQPCQNGATCINELDDFACICGPGWSGKDCNHAHECVPLGVPQHGLILCNGWRTDYFRICLGVCLQGFGFVPIESGTQLYMCTASGLWIPLMQGYEPGQLPSCYAPYANNTLSYKGHLVPVVADCNTPNSRTSLGKFYVDSLMADVNVKDMCTDYKNECKPENVEIRCQP